jgi:hypothetical protein
MRLEITRVEGLRNDLLLRIDRAEIDTARLSVANRDRLMALPGMSRHRPASAEEAQGIADAKVPIEEHLRLLGVVDASGKARQRAIAISNRNLGTNHGHVAWQRGETPPVVRIAEDPFARRPRSCLTVRAGGRLSIETLSFDVGEQRIQAVDGEQDVSDEVEWATYGQQVLRHGTVARVDDLIDEFYDLRHVLAFDHRHEHGERIRQEIYEGYPGYRPSGTSAIAFVLKGPLNVDLPGGSVSYSTA